eukprot:7433683-Pyramimonas_sp.AAC.1
MIQFLPRIFAGTTCLCRALAPDVRSAACFPWRRGSGYILTTDQSDAGSAYMFSRRTSQTQEAR